MQKDPNSRLPFTVDWTAWLAAEQDTAASATWVVPEGITQESAAFADGKATIWLSGGTPGQTYAVTCRLTTTGGRIDDRTLHISIRHR